MASGAFFFSWPALAPPQLRTETDRPPPSPNGLVVFGGRMQIHINLGRPLGQQITIFSKSKRDSTRDRLSTHSYVAPFST